MLFFRRFKISPAYFLNFTDKADHSSFWGTSSEARSEYRKRSLCPICYISTVKRFVNLTFAQVNGDSLFFSKHIFFTFFLFNKQIFHIMKTSCTLFSKTPSRVAHVCL